MKAQNEKVQKTVKLKLNKKTVFRLGKKQIGAEQAGIFFQTWDDIITGCTSRMTNDGVRGPR
ncbi:MAG: hypothetical protein NTW29_10180 [Bacteroidetes bacterium]|nr:hypothetical protein [Bacteroidota bacterium]